MISASKTHQDTCHLQFSLLFPQNGCFLSLFMLFVLNQKLEIVQSIFKQENNATNWSSASFFSFLCSMCSSPRPTASGPFMKSWLKGWPLTWRAMSILLSGMSWRFVPFLLLSPQFVDFKMEYVSFKSVIMSYYFSNSYKMTPGATYTDDY